MSGFYFKKSLITKDSPALLSYIINNSEALHIGDAVRLDTNGNVIAATAGTDILGIVFGIADSKGLPITPDSGTLQTYTASSTNETVALNVAMVAVTKDACYKGIVGSGALATTNLLQWFDLSNAYTLNISSASDTAGQFQLIGLDPDGDGDTTKGLFIIAESQLDPYVQQ